MLSTSFNRDVPQEVVRRILDHDSHRMTGRYAQLSDTTIRRHWEAARKVNIKGETVTLDPDGPLAEAAWASQRIGRATQALPNGYCGLPVVKACPHANACLTCPMFATTPQFLPQHHQQRQQVIQIISAAEARGQQRLAERSCGCATSAAGHPGRRCRHTTAAATPPCSAGCRSPPPATGNWPRTTSSCATNSPKPSGNSAPPASAPTRGQRRRDQRKAALR